MNRGRKWTEDDSDRHTFELRCLFMARVTSLVVARSIFKGSTDSLSGLARVKTNCHLACREKMGSKEVTESLAVPIGQDISQLDLS